jgi:hypothetical protein
MSMEPGRHGFTSGFFSANAPFGFGFTQTIKSQIG